MTTFTTKGIEYGWVVGENGWGDPMNLNLQRLSAMGFGPFSIGPDGVSGLDVDVAGGLWWNASTETWDTVADATLTLTNAATNYVEVSVAGVISANTTGFTYGARPVAVVVTAAGAVTTITDRRTYGGDEPIAPGRLMGRDRSGTTSLKTGLDAVGSNTAAVDFVVDAPRSTGNATPALYKVRVATQGSSGAALQTLADAWQVGEVATASSRAVAAWNPAGPVYANIPTDIASSLLADGIGGTVGVQFRIIRAASNPSFIGVRVNTSLQAPSATLNAQTVFGFEGRGYSSGSAGVVQLAEITAVTRENTTDTNRGALWRFRVVPLAEASLISGIDVRSPATGTIELVGIQTTWRFIPATSGSFAWRTAANSADTMTLNEAGTTVTFPLATAYVIGADPGGSALLRVAGNARFGSGTQIDATNTGFLNVNTTASSVVAGGNSVTNGGNARFFGGSHATQANDIEFRSGSTVRGFWDDSATTWQFGGFFAVGGATPVSTTYLITPAGTTGVSSLRIPHGAAPSSPVDGDMWTTTAGLFVRINGATVGPLS